MKLQPLAFLVLLTACIAREPSLTYSNGVVRAEGWSGNMPKEGWPGVLSIRAGEDPNAPAMLGEYKVEGGIVTFTPRFPPAPGLALHATFHVNQKTIEATFGEPAKALLSSTTVEHIYPSTDEWPANTLRMYMQFSAPMAAGEAYSHIRVLDADGHAIEKPFVEIEPELWDAQNRRLTVLFDPGRIKRGLVDNETAGPPLVPGKPVTIEVDAAWRDATGAPLKQIFTRTVRATEALRKAVDVKTWRVVGPREPLAPLVIQFDRPLDHALARRAIQVMKGGSPVAGEIAIEENETRFKFTPGAPWSPGKYVVRVDGVIEDVAGNRLGKLFDVDTMDPRQSASAATFEELTFTVPAR